MTNPQFPDQLGMREVVRPGATASKAGPDMLQRVAALEQGALGRPGPEIANGCTITSDTTQTGGVKWEANGGSYTAALYLANSGAPTHTSNGGWQLVHAGGGTDAWTAEWDKRPSGVAAQVNATAGIATITIQKAGVYRVQSCVTFTSITSGKVVAGGVAINGAGNPAAPDVRHTGATEQITLRTDDLMSLAVSDYLQLMAFQNDSASEAYNVGGGKYSNRLTIEYVGQST